MNERLCQLIQASKWTRAFVESLAALLLGLVIVGMFFLPNEIQEQRTNPQKHVVACCLSNDTTTAIALVATKHSHQISNRILRSR